VKFHKQKTNKQTNKQNRLFLQLKRICFLSHSRRNQTKCVAISFLAEIFGRPHNCWPGWITLGNQVDGNRVVDKDIQERLVKLNQMQSQSQSQSQSQLQQKHSPFVPSNPAPKFP
jgi:hypothetical protein